MSIVRTIHFTIRKFFWWLRGRRVCPYCGEVRNSLVECPECGVEQCSENCFPPKDQKYPGHCSVCEYPDG